MSERSMRERLARVLCERLGENFESASAASRLTYLRTVDALLTELETPTEGMADSGESSLICGPSPDDRETSPSETWAHAKSCWQSMIRAIRDGK